MAILNKVTHVIVSVAIVPQMQKSSTTVYRIVLKIIDRDTFR